MTGLLVVYGSTIKDETLRTQEIGMSSTGTSELKRNIDLSYNFMTDSSPFSHKLLNLKILGYIQNNYRKIFIILSCDSNNSTFP